MKPNLNEARRLLDMGMSLVQLEHMSKRPVGLGWNKPENQARQIDPEATGYGLPLAANNLCSVDPDNWDAAKKVMDAWGLDLEEIMSAGVRTRSTRPGSGGRATFQGEPGLNWIRIRTKKLGVVLELRANSTNLQDAVPGVIYEDREGNICTQEYVSERKLDEAPALHDALMELWQRATEDIDFLHELERLAAETLADRPVLSVSNGLAKSQLAFNAPGVRSRFNSENKVEGLLGKHGYAWHEREQRWSAPNSTGAPGIRPIPGKNDLWQSDHASDPLCGTFDAWAAHVQLDHGGSLEAAFAQFEREHGQLAREAFADYLVDPETGELVIHGEGEVADAVQPTHHLHPLANVVSLQYNPKPPEFVLDGLIQVGVAVIAGQPGVGKTTNLLPLAAAIAHLCPVDFELRPRVRRHVIWITEDIAQVESVIAALIRDAGWSSKDDFNAWFHVVPAVRMAATDVAKIATFYKAKFTTEAVLDSGHVKRSLPLVVIDTSNAVIDVENENDNALIGRSMAAIKQGFEGFPVWIISHLPKGPVPKKAEDITARGASAWGADATQTCFLVKDQDKGRQLVLGKTRFESKWHGVLFESQVTLHPVVTEFGLEEVPLRHAIGKPFGNEDYTRQLDSDGNRLVMTSEQELRTRLIEIAEAAFNLGRPLSKSELTAKAGGNKSRAIATIDNLSAEAWFYAFTLSDEARARMGKSKRAGEVLYPLSADEHDKALALRETPPDVLQKIAAFNGEGKQST